MRRSIVFLVAIVMAAPAFAVPQLQLDIVGGTYNGDAGIETIIAPQGNMLTLVALLTPTGNPNQDLAALLAGPYYISAAVLSDPDADPIGSFMFAGATVTSEDLVFGVPPVEAAQLHDGGDLGDHGIFDTWFWQSLGFSFSNVFTTETYDTQLNPGGPSETAGGTYYRLFEIDTTNLGAGHQLHFDLYSVKTAAEPDGKKKALNGDIDIDIDKFAPFSHDAETNRNGHELPEPSTLLLLGAGLVGLFARNRRRS